MKETTTLPVTLQTLNDDVSLPTRAQIAELLDGLGGDAGLWMTVNRIPYVPGEYIQVTLAEDGPDLVEHKEFTGDQYGASVDRASVVRLFEAWATEDPEWKSTVSWERTAFTPAPVAAPSFEAVEYATDQAETWVASGEHSYDEIIEFIMESAESDDEIDEQQAAVILNPIWMKQVIAQRDWPETTDNDRLTTAFESLGRSGITARESFACCMSCGVSEIGGERDDDDTGYVFFHEQDTERAARGDDLMLAYGAYGGDPKSTIEIGHRIVAAVEASGLTCEWDGSAKSRIIIAMNWRKRLV